MSSETPTVSFQYRILNRRDIPGTLYQGGNETTTRDHARDVLQDAEDPWWSARRAEQALNGAEAVARHGEAQRINRGIWAVVVRPEYHGSNPTRGKP